MKTHSAPPAFKCGHVTFVVSDEDGIIHINFNQASVVFMDMQSVSSYLHVRVVGCMFLVMHKHTFFKMYCVWTLYHTFFCIL